MTLVTAESCTGGLIGKYMTDLPGSSRVYWGGYVSYSNEAKTGMLAVSGQLLSTAGAVSEDAVKGMALGALSRSTARDQHCRLGNCGSGWRDGGEARGDSVDRCRAARRDSRCPAVHLFRLA